LNQQIPFGARPQRACADQPSTTRLPSILSLFAAHLLVAALWAEEPAPTALETERADWVSQYLVDSLQPTQLQSLTKEVLDRSPELARLEARLEAASARAPQLATLPDPVARVSVFAISPETRVGPQRFSVGLEQTLPWFGKLGLRESRALLEARALASDLEALRLDLITETRRLYYELAYLEVHAAILNSEQKTLERFEEEAVALYASGRGTQSTVLDLQIRLTRIAERHFVHHERTAGFLAQLNRLRDQPAATPVVDPELPTTPLDFDLPPHQQLVDMARARRPEFSALAARIAAHESGLELEERNHQPDLTVGLGYTFVDERQDAVGRTMPPEGNGDDIVSFHLQLPLPFRLRARTAAQIQSAAELQAVREESEILEADIEAELGDLETRLPLLVAHYRLLDGVLITQTRAALEAAEVSYSLGQGVTTGLLAADLQHFEVATSTARTAADFAIARAHLERAVAQPLNPSPESPPDLQPAGHHHD
jgi:outer membrane protein TolC